MKLLYNHAVYIFKGTVLWEQPLYENLSFIKITEKFYYFAAYVSSTDIRETEIKLNF